MKIPRRDFVTLLGGAAVARPLAARSQQSDRMRRIGVLTADYGSAQGEAQFGVFRQVLRDLGWIEGRNIQIDLRWGRSETARIRAAAQELVALKPDVIFVQSTRVLLELRQYTTTIPTVFIGVSDPMGHGFLSSLAHPGGNLTGFSNFEFSLVGKWLQALKEVAPSTKRVALLMHPDNGSYPNYRPIFEKFAAELAIEPVFAPVRTRAEIEAALQRLAGGSSGVLLPGDTFTQNNGDLVVSLADRHRVPGIYNQRSFVDIGGLMSYGHDQVEPYRGAASYVDRIMRGEKPGDLPVQQPTKYELVINLKTAKAQGLTVPTGLLVRADEVIE